MITEKTAPNGGRDTEGVSISAFPKRLPGKSTALQ
jgi:hypothetical protein